jgi:hypothetical protein
MLILLYPALHYLLSKVNILQHVRFEVFTVVMMLMVWILAPCSSVGTMLAFRRSMLSPSSGFPFFSTLYLPLCNLLGDFLLVRSNSSLIVISVWPIPSAVFPLTLPNPCTSQLYHFSPEDGDSIFLRNVCICLQNYTAQKPKT